MCGNLSNEKCDLCQNRTYKAKHNQDERHNHLLFRHVAGLRPHLLNNFKDTKDNSATIGQIRVRLPATGETSVKERFLALAIRLVLLLLRVLSA
jgi:hypothetical protein